MPIYCLIALLCLLPAPLEVNSSSVTFYASTNVPGVEIKGKSTSLTAHTEVTRSENAIILAAIDASLPVKSLDTGMKVRDDHMRKYIFTTADGEQPDIRFSSRKVTCPSAQEFSCQLAGEFSMRGIARPFEISLRIKQSGSAYRAEGDGIVKLSDYGIDPPTQFGVKPLNDVKFHVVLAAKER